MTLPIYTGPSTRLAYGKVIRGNTSDITVFVMLRAAFFFKDGEVEVDILNFLLKYIVFIKLQFDIEISGNKEKI